MYNKSADLIATQASEGPRLHDWAPDCVRCFCSQKFVFQEALSMPTLSALYDQYRLTPRVCGERPGLQPVWSMVLANRFAEPVVGQLGDRQIYCMSTLNVTGYTTVMSTHLSEYCS